MHVFMKIRSLGISSAVGEHGTYNKVETEVH